MRENSSVIGQPSDAKNETTLLLVESRDKFLNFVRSLVHDRDEAEEILQRASLKVVARAGTLRRPSRREAWIYRLLRNEVIDHFRRLSFQFRRTAEFPEDLAAAGSDFHVHVARPCPCAREELANLPANYSDALRRMEMDDQAIALYAAKKGVSVNSATVTLHRARKSLRARIEMRCGVCAGPGCFDCSCPA